MAKRSRVEGIPNDGGQRSKRRKAQDGTPEVEISSDHAHSDGEGKSGGKDEVKQQGLKMWQAVKEAVGKDHHVLSALFLVQPDKHVYPDYYAFIKHPIALNDIKRKCNFQIYNTLQDVKNDFDLCFDNAKTYNAEGSQIYQDAVEMQRIVADIFKELSHAGKSAEKKQHKGPSLRKIMKSKLQDLVKLTDSTGRIVSGEFMELPNPKTWAIYYQQIDKPQCFDNIFKRIKKREYASMDEFADDVELVFANCFRFNQENTGIWTDASTLQKYFREIMADLPAPFTVARYARPTGPKIKIKMPVASTSQQPPPPPPAPKIIMKAEKVAAKLAQTIESSPARVQPTPTAKATPTPQPASAVNAARSPKPVPAPSAVKSAPTKPTRALSKAQTAPVSTSLHAQVPAQATQGAASIHVAVTNGKVATSQLPASTSIQPVPPASTPVSQPSTQAYIPAATPAPVLPSAANRAQTTNQDQLSSTAIPAPYVHQIRFVRMKSVPCGRPYVLDHKDGVKSWFIRLGPEEQSLIMSEICYVRDDEDGESSADEDDEEPKPKRGRGRPKKGTTAPPPPKAKPTRKRPKLGELQVKLNGSVVKDVDASGETRWNIAVPVGSSIIEVGEEGGLVWKVYTHRTV